MKPIPQIITLLSVLVLPVTGIASSSTGTGNPKIQLSVSDDQRVVLALNEQQQWLIGSADMQQGYAELPLDAFSSDATQSNWGEAHILLGCGQADILVYQNQNGNRVEVAATQLAIDECVE